MVSERVRAQRAAAAVLRRAEARRRRAAESAAAADDALHGAIVAGNAAGLTVREIADLVGLSAGRIGQILVAERGAS